jgi:hypothetical protein
VSTGFQGYLVPYLLVIFEHSFRNLVFGDSIRFLEPPTLAPIVVSAEKQLTIPPQKKSKKNTPTEAG